MEDSTNGLAIIQDINNCAPPLTKEEARALTDEIKATAEQVWALLLEAHDRLAWDALGYPSWRDYAMAEFNMSQSHAYRLLDQARFIRDISEAAGNSPMGEISERVARDLKPVLPQVVERVRQLVADIPEEEIERAVAQVIEEERQKVKAKEDFRALMRETGLDKVTPEEKEREEHRIQTIYRLFEALKEIDQMPEPAVARQMVKPYEQDELAPLERAIQWLQEFAQEVRK